MLDLEVEAVEDLEDDVYGCEPFQAGKSAILYYMWLG